MLLHFILIVTDTLSVKSNLLSKILNRLVFTSSVIFNIPSRPEKQRLQRFSNGNFNVSWWIYE